MTTRQKINELEPWDERLADSMLRERDMWLDAAMSVCIRSSRTRKEAVKQLAEAMEDYLQDALEQLCYTTPSHVANAMDGFCQLDPNLCFECIADALMEDYWPEGSPKPANPASMNRRPTAGRSGYSASKTRKAPAKKNAPARKANSRRY